MTAACGSLTPLPSVRAGCSCLRILLLPSLRRVPRPSARLDPAPALSSQFGAALLPRRAARTWPTQRRWSCSSPRCLSDSNTEEGKMVRLQQQWARDVTKALQRFFASLVQSANTSFNALLDSLICAAKPSQSGGLAKQALSCLCPLV